MTNTHRTFSTVLTLLTATTLACDPGIDADDDSRETDPVVLDELDEIVENLLAAGYPRSEITVVDGEVVVGGDAVVSLAASREMVPAEPDEEGFRQYRSTNLVTVDTICVDGSAYTGTMSDALDAALIEFNSVGLDFVMIRTSGNQIGCDAVITAGTRSDDQGKAGFPSNGLPYDSIKIGTQIENYGFDRVVHVMVHELGHCVGFRHTDYFNRTISCGQGGNEGSGTEGAQHIPNTPTGAVFDGSVMNSCYNYASTGQWTNDDVTALVELYGAEFCEAFDGYQIAFESAHGGYVRSGISSENYIVNQQSYIGLHERWTVECDGDSPTFRNPFGRYLTAGTSSNGWLMGQQNYADAYETFTPIRQADGTWALKTYHQRYMRAPSDFGDSLDQQTYIGAWEKFTVALLADEDDVGTEEQLTLREFAEVGSVSVGSDWVDVELSRSFSNPVVIAGPPSFNGSDPVVVRVRNVTSTGFEIKVQEYDYDDGVHTNAERVAWMVIEAGVNVDDDGIVWEAGTFTADGGREVETTRSFANAFSSAPMLLATAQTANGGSAFALRVDDLGSSSFHVLLDEEEANTDGHVNETVGYLALSAAPASDAIKTVYVGYPTVDDEWTSVDAISLKMEEETSKDTELDHNAELVHVLGITPTAGGHAMYFAQDTTYAGQDTAALRWK